MSPWNFFDCPEDSTMIVPIRKQWHDKEYVALFGKLCFFSREKKSQSVSEDVNKIVKAALLQLTRTRWSWCLSFVIRGTEYILGLGDFFFLEEKSNFGVRSVVWSWQREAILQKKSNARSPFPYLNFKSQSICWSPRSSPFNIFLYFLVSASHLIVSGFI